MHIKLSVLIVLFSSIPVGCAPEKKCSGTLYYDPSAEVCRPCPKGSSFKNDTCECDAQYEFMNNRCVLQDGAVADIADAGKPTTATCAQYCDFAAVCIGHNSLAKAALSDVVSGLHADDTAACTNSCQSDLSGDGSSDSVVACVAAGRDQAMCADQSTADGLSGAITLLSDCCRPAQDDALCQSICKTVKANAVLGSMTDFCK